MPFQCEELLTSQKTQTGSLATHTVGEYYTSGVIANMIEQERTPRTERHCPPRRL